MDGEELPRTPEDGRVDTCGEEAERNTVSECTSSNCANPGDPASRGNMHDVATLRSSSSSTAPSRRRHRRGQKRKRSKNSKHRLVRAGKPTAPFNSTQFLIADHGAETPVCLRSPERHSRSNISADSSLSDYDDSAEDDMEEGSYFEKDFAEAYAEAERLKEDALMGLKRTGLHLLSRVELLQRCQTLEQRLNEDKAVIAKLREENERLRVENESFR